MGQRMGNSVHMEPEENEKRERLRRGDESRDWSQLVSIH
jgi:hypothetical protein